MKNIISRTLETTVKKVSLIITVVLSVIGAYAIKSAVSQISASYRGTLAVASNGQHLIVFFLLGGILLLSIINNGSDMIASEYAEGTLKLLMAKPNSRAVILLSKLIGVWVGETILLAVSLLAYYVSLMAFGQLDGNLFADLLSYLPGYVLYGLLLIFIINGIAALLSCVSKKKIIAMLPLLAFVIIMLGFFPIKRMVTFLSQGTGDNTLDIIDINYHFFLILKQCIKPFGEIFANGSTTEVMSMLSNLFTNRQLDMDIVGQMGNMVTVANDHLNSLIVMAVYVAVSVLCYILAFISIRKKDV